ncbi:MAG: DinB family protein [Actinomycetota bacterium]|nr:DinB family protein [Actinomycetota bacterium]
MYTPARHDEITGLVNHLDAQLSAVRAAAIGLTEEQATSRPCRSSLSIGGLIKHVTQVMQGAIDRYHGTGAGPDEYDEGAIAAYHEGFTVTGDETVAGVIAQFDRTRVEYLAAVRTVDPSAPTTEPPAPWFGVFDERPAHARYHLVHQVEEIARHAGHADIIREQIDGVSVPAIVLSEAGAPANDFLQPYTPAPGTIGAPQG